MKISFLLLSGLIFLSCNGLKSIKSAFADASPYEKYIHSLDKAGLLRAPMAKEWVLVGEKVFSDSVMVSLPFAESGYFEAGHPNARSYRFNVKDGQVITIEGELKTIGNTGNAKSTPPHLHFGIYQSGSKDPLHYIHTVEAAIRSLPIDTGFHYKPFKVKRKQIKLMSGPSEKLLVKGLLNKDTYMTVIAQRYDWYRVALPDHTQGFILKKQVIPLDKGLVTKFKTARLLLSETRQNAVPIALLQADTDIEILASFKEYAFVQTAQGKAGWLYN